MVEDTQLSLAIGKRGQNVRLAAQITGWKLDIISKTKLQKRIQDAIANLMLIEGVNETQARALAQVGVLNIRQFAETSIESILRVPGFEEREVAERYKAKAQALVDEGASFVNGVQSTVNTITPDNDAKSVASEKLKEMIQQAEGASAGGTSE